MANLSSLYTTNTSKRKTKTGVDQSVKNISIVGYSILAFSIIVLFQIFRWQILDVDKFQSLAEEQYKSNAVQTAQRGIITAVDGTILAVDEPVWDVYATLSKDEDERKLFFDNKDKFVTTVSSILGVEESEVSSKLTDDFVYVSLKKDVSTEKKKALETANIFGDGTTGFGMYFESKEKRIYPNGELAAHLVGFIGQDLTGKALGQYGIQGYYFGDITGSEGYSYEEKDSAGNVILTSEYEPILPREGKDFVLTIKPNIQTKVEQALKAGVQTSRAKSGSVIIMNPKTGEIIAMANYPTYNPNEYWRVSESWILKNRAVSDVYEYGSVQKPITFALALQSKAITKDYSCTDNTGSLDLYEATGYADLKGRKIYTWDKKPDGKMDISGVLGNSNNPCTAKVGLTMGFPTFYSGLKDFGIGEFIGIGLQEESTSYLKAYEEWTKLDLITASYGQSISATPLQILSAFSVFANDGKRMRPYIISEIKDDSETIKIEPQIASQPISSEVADIVRDALKKAVIDNSLGNLAKDMKNYNVAAKTGTAQVAKVGSTGYEDSVTNASVIGFAPADDAKMVMIVKLEEPQISTYASLSAVPTWRSIFLAVADDLEIKKNN